jgi:hypothetical protein
MNPLSDEEKQKEKDNKSRDLLLENGSLESIKIGYTFLLAKYHAAVERNSRLEDEITELKLRSTIDSASKDDDSRLSALLKPTETNEFLEMINSLGYRVNKLEEEKRKEKLTQKSPLRAAHEAKKIYTKNSKPMCRRKRMDAKIADNHGYSYTRGNLASYDSVLEGSGGHAKKFKT